LCIILHLQRTWTSTEEVSAPPKQIFDISSLFRPVLTLTLYSILYLCVIVCTCCSDAGQWRIGKERNTISWNSLFANLKLHVYIHFHNVIIINML
jgi:hypothetical protein